MFENIEMNGKTGLVLNWVEQKFNNKILLRAYTLYFHKN